MLTIRLLGRREPNPAVAAKAPVPSHPAVVPGNQVVLRADLSGVDADQVVALPAADDQLPVDVTPAFAEAGARRAGA